MSAEKPIHVRVAEALGWTEIHPRLGTGYPPEGPLNGNPTLPASAWPRCGCLMVPRYDTDWSATGPMIERFGITVRPHCTENERVTSWAAERNWPIETEPGRAGATPLLAVCHLLEALSAAGKLEKVA